MNFDPLTSPEGVEAEERAKFHQELGEHFHHHSTPSSLGLCRHLSVFLQVSWPVEAAALEGQAK